MAVVTNASPRTRRRASCVTVAASSAKRDEMIDEKELTKRLMASIEIEMKIPPYQMGVANVIVRRIVPGTMRMSALQFLAFLLCSSLMQRNLSRRNASPIVEPQQQIKCSPRFDFPQNHRGETFR